MLKKKCNRYVILLLVQILILLALLLGCFRKEQLVYSLVGEDVWGLEEEIENGTAVKGEFITLTPGVYQVRVQANVEEGQEMSVEMDYENAYYESMRSNAVTVFPGDEYIEFEVYVLDKVPTAYVRCEFDNMDASGLLQLDIYKTGMGARLLLFVVTVGFMILDSMLIFRKRILEGKVTKKQQVIFWTLAAGVLLAYYPYLTDYVILGYDTTFHLSRIAYLKDSLLEGSLFPVRVQSTWLRGHGYAVSLFYGDIFLYIPAVLMIIGFPLMTAYKIFILLVMVATAMIAYHCFKKCAKEEYAALFGSMIYLLGPYRLLNVYGRGAVGEFLAMTFLPLVCCGMYLLYTEDVSSKDYKKHKWYVIWGIAALLQCHIISVEMVALFMAIVCVVLWKKTFRKQTFLQLLQAVGIVLLISGWFLIPLLYMMNADAYNLSDLTQADIASRGLSIAEIFQLLPTREGIKNEIWGHEPAHIGAGAAMLLVVYSVWQCRTHKGSKVSNVFAMLSVLALVMCTNLLPWNHMMKIPGIGFALASLQFPWRFMSLASVCVAMFAVFFYVDVSVEGETLVKVAMGIAGAIIIATAVYQVNCIVFEEKAIYLYEEGNIGTANVVSGEYLLAGVDTSDIYYHKPVAETGLQWSQYEKCGTDVSIKLNNMTGETLHIEIPLMGYKGYGIKAEDAEEIPYITEERGAHGDLRIAVPAGYQGTLQISYTGVTLFHVAEAVSVISLAGLLGIYLYRKRKRLQNEE